MTQPIEILVHVSGPSRGRDDTRYRKEARGFLDFEPVKKYRILENDSEGSDGDEEREISLEELHGLEEWEKEYNRNNYISGDQGRNDGQPVACVGKEKSLRDARVEGNRGPNKQNDEEAQEDTSDLVSHSRYRGNVVGRVQAPLKERESNGGRNNETLSRVQEDFLKGSFSKHTPSRHGNIVPSNLGSSSHPPKAGLRTPKLPQSTPSPFIILSSVKETPHVLITRTPAFPAPGKTPLEQSYAPKPRPVLCRAQSDSWETPPSTIPDSQPNIRPLELAEISSSPCLKRPFLSSSPSPTHNSPPGAKRPRLQVSASPLMDQESSQVAGQPGSENSQVSRSPTSPTGNSQPSPQLPRLKIPSSPPLGPAPSSPPPVEEPASETSPKPPSIHSQSPLPTSNSQSSLTSLGPQAISSSSWEELFPDITPQVPSRPPSSSSNSSTPTDEFVWNVVPEQPSSLPLYDEPSSLPSQPTNPAPPIDEPEPLNPALPRPPYPCPPHFFGPNMYCLYLAPPPPVISNQHFTTHINAAMTRMQTQLPLSKGYDPFILYQTRRLQVLERGQWQIPLSTWSSELIADFWGFLKIQIETGNAGFCTRAFRVHVDEFGATVDNRWTTEKRRVKEEVCQVWCWGEIVGEVWLFLLLGSRKATRGCGVRWLAADGEPVVVMK